MVLILHFRKSFYTEQERCVALGRDEDNVTQAIFLSPVMSNCSAGSRCFKRVTPLIKNCEVSWRSFFNAIKRAFAQISYNSKQKQSYAFKF